MPKIGDYRIKILQFPFSPLFYISKTHFEGHLWQFSFQSYYIGNFTFTFKRR